MYTEREIIVNFDGNMKLLEKGEIPFSYYYMSHYLISRDLIHLRGIYTETYGFSLVSLDWNKLLVDKIIKGAKCLEIMGGTGLWSQALETLGVDIICTDNLTWEKKSKPRWKNHRTEVLDMDAVQAIETFGKDVSFILMSWPYMDNTAYKCLKKMREVNPYAMMIYIGENMGGCTADNDFFESMHQINNDALKEINSLYRSFPGINDSIYLIK